MSDVRRDIPRTDVVLADPRLAAARARLGVDAVKAAVRGAQQKARDGEIAAEAVVEVAVASLPSSATTLRPILNATGVVLHTNLGRAPLAPAAVEACDGQKLGHQADLG
ncbi:selenocysteine synthase [Catenulispora acidiphila DSM 44928]|uniref:Selenocysteine synthase n=1 Tax=Catenulispora acidiphila (strain DSM 44928 / JCM 14897 / NBRC 102108 / NRRL B-24433 / ID139908) TaxID=479433 RepID=C7PXE0_CATAD|nr:L-selenocysteinyl-tRNA(Sec) synthase [Catenulispora acidiphila]ACU69491.1 selenocysteine synthase [Catenulispora acidiphila DSM 44928]